MAKQPTVILVAFKNILLVIDQSYKLFEDLLLKNKVSLAQGEVKWEQLKQNY